MADKTALPDAEDFERRLRDLFRYKDITDVCRHSGGVIRYGSLTKQLNPNDPTPSLVYEMLVLLKGCYDTRPELESEVWALLSGARRTMLPSEPQTPNGLDATYFDLKATLARYGDGLATDEEVEKARNRHAEATARAGSGVRLMGRAEVARDLRQSAG